MLSPRARIAAGALLFSTGGAAIKGADFAGWQVASFRSGIACLALLLLLPAARRGLGWRPALVGVAYAATLIAYVLANRLTTSANTIYLQSTAPLYLLLLGPWLLHEPVRRRDWPIIAAVFGGLALVFLGADRPSVTAPDPAKGNLIALSSGLSYALVLVGLRWLSRRDDPDGPMAAVAMGNGIAFLAALPMAWPVGHHAMISWGVIGYLGVFQIAFAYLLVTSGLRHVTALEASLLLLVETACNPIWSWVLLGEVPTRLALLGGALIIGATAIQALRPPETVTPQEAG